MQPKHFCLIAAFSFVIIFSQSLGAQDDDERFKHLYDKLREQQPPTLTYSELTEKADVIVVAKLESKSKIKRDGKIAGKFAIESTTLIKNRLKLLATLKGDVDNEINVYTLRWKPDVIVLTNSDFAEFRKKQRMSVNVPVVIDGEITGFAEILEGDKTCSVEPEYLLFLKKSGDNKYIPITGQRYSGFSVKRLK